MLRALINRRIDKAERQLGVSMDYLRHMARASLPAFLKFTKIISVASYRRACPADVAHVAGLVAVLEADCGPCVQIGVNLAKHDGVPDEVLRAVLARRPEDLPPDLVDAYHFAEEVVMATGGEGPYRDCLTKRLGDAAVVELSIAIAVARVFPTTKRALGYATSCANVHAMV